jgi:hypothetical protein
MNDVPARPGGGTDRPDDEARDDAAGAQPELASVDQSLIRPTRRRYGEGLPSSGPNEQSSTPMWVARPTDPGTSPGTDAEPEGAAEVEDRRRGAPDPASPARPDAGRPDAAG